MPPAIELRGVTKVFLTPSGGVYTALRDLNLTVQPGEFCAVVGPTGCGKSTTLALISGLEPPSAGRVEVFGQQVTGIADGIGYVFQADAVFPWKTVLENVAFGPRMRGRPAGECESTAREYLALVGLGHVAARYPAELSGGMQQRVGVVRALANNPDVLLMDEPFASVDAQTRMTLQEELTRIWLERQPTIVFITHDVEEAVFLANRVVVLSKGRVLKEIAVPLPRPRAWDTLIEDAGFKALSKEVLDLVRAA